MGQSLVGRKLGPYQLQAVVGQGGMGIVYRARQPGAERTVAVKVVGEPLSREAAFLRRFAEEARASARLVHPHILPVFDVGTAGREPYIVTPYLTGGTLAGRIAARPVGLPLPEAVRVCAQIAAALDYAHAEGLVHCDLKPGNILLDAQGNAYLTDFGIARLGGQLAPEPGSPPGTPPYVAPEVMRGQPPTPASDIYSLGMVTFEMLAGRRPSHEPGAAGPDVGLLRPGLPGGVRIAVAQALSPDPASRPPQAIALAQALGRANGHAQPSALIEPAAPPGNGGQPAGLHTPPPEPAAGRTTSGYTPPPTRPSARARPAGRRAALRRTTALGWAVTALLLVPLLVLFVLVMLSLGQPPAW